MSKKPQNKAAAESQGSTAAQAPAATEQQQPAAETTEQKPERARNEDGTFVADDPATPDVNEAYVQPPAAEAPPATEQAKPEQEIDATEAAFVVVSHIKVNGTRYAPGADVSGLTADDAARMLASGSIKPKE